MIFRKNYHKPSTVSVWWFWCFRGFVGEKLNLNNKVSFGSSTLGVNSLQTSQKYVPTSKNIDLLWFKSRQRILKLFPEFICFLEINQNFHTDFSIIKIYKVKMLKSLLKRFVDDESYASPHHMLYVDPLSQRRKICYPITHTVWIVHYMT